MGTENKNFAQIAEEAFKKAFGIKTEVDVESKLNKTEEQIDKVREQIDIKNTWVWVEGYKGTDRDMKCQGFQYEIGPKYSIPRDEVDECHNGFHMCLNMNDVTDYYSIGNGNRYFKVRALVRLTDKNEYGKLPEYDPDDMYQRLFGRKARNKMAAAEIEFLEELTVDEILSNTIAKDWDDKYKKLAIELGIDGAKRTRQIDILTGYGYSLPFASYLIDNKKYSVAEAVGSQPDLSMDMKVLMIMQG